MSVKWTCPLCDDTVLGPERPVSDATCRVCLDCSKGRVRLVKRAAPSLVKRRAARAAAKAEREQRAQEKQAQRRAEQKRALAKSAAHERWTRGFDLEDLCAHVHKAVPPGLVRRQDFQGLVVGALGKRAANDPAWVAAVACWVTRLTPQFGMLSLGIAVEDRGRPYAIAEACWGARPAIPVTSHTAAYRALYPSLRAIFDERATLHRALSVVASLISAKTGTTADDALLRICACRELGQVLDGVHTWSADGSIDGTALLDADPVPGVPSLREASANLPPDTPVWEEFLVPCPRDLLGLPDEPAGRALGTPVGEYAPADPLSQGGEVYRHVHGFDEVASTPSAFASDIAAKHGHDPDTCENCRNGWGHLPDDGSTP